MNKPQELFLACIRCELASVPLDEKIISNINEEIIKQTYLISHSQDMDHLVADALLNMNLLDCFPEWKQKFEQSRFLAIYRYEQMKYELDRLCELLEKSKIDFVPLKGAEIRKFYPEPWMRTSCDIDVLVREETADATADLIAEKLEYARKEKGTRDISLVSPSGVVLELHFIIIADDLFLSGQKYFKNQWSYTAPIDGYSFRYAFNDDMFYLLHIAHMAKHFRIGGCGVRYFADIWVMLHYMKISNPSGNTMVEESGLKEFSEASIQLSEGWFSGLEISDDVQKLAEFVLESAVYGTLESEVNMSEQINKSKMRYIGSKIFVSRKVLKNLYPILNKHPWMMPFAFVARLLRLFTTRFGYTVRQIKYVFCHSEKKDIAKELLETYNLK